MRVTKYGSQFVRQSVGGQHIAVARAATAVTRVAPSSVATACLARASSASPLTSRHYDALTRRAPDALSLVAAQLCAPPAPFVPPALQFHRVVAIAACHVGAVDEGAQAVSALRAFGAPAVDTFGVQNYVDIQRWFDDSVPHGLHYHCRSEWLKPLDGDAIEALIEAARSATSPMSQVLVRHMGGATWRVAPDATAFRFRAAEHLLTLACIWQPDDAQPQRHRQWCRDAWATLRGASAGGGYVNHLTDEGEDRTREAYGEQTWERLVAAKRRYDPTNLFRMNQNIRPG
jgi:FAD/FMN-containing dehydrogenase